MFSPVVWKCLPRDARRIIDPRLFRLSVTTCCLALLDDSAAGCLQASVDVMKFLLAFDLNAKVIEAWLAPARRDGEVHARIIEHPFRIVILND